MKTRITKLLAIAWVGLVAVCCTVHAQAPNATLNATRLAKDLEFPQKVSRHSFFSAPEMALYKPEGSGPFPALVLMHQCGGLRGKNWQNLSMLEWTRTAVAQGYVALLVDSLGPRGATSVCNGPQEGVNFARGVRDALQAAEHLRTFDFVDKNRIAVAGYSWGAMNAVLASSQRWSERLAPGARFAAAVAFYPGCFTIRPAGGNPYEVVQPDIDRPLLVLMGAEDTETPADACVTQLESAKAHGAPLQWHVYAQATHCWDCRNLHNFSKVVQRGLPPNVREVSVEYHYDEGVTRDSEQRMFEFLRQAMPAVK